MKAKRFLVFGLPVLLLALGLVLTGCDTGSTNGGGDPSGSGNTSDGGDANGGDNTGGGGGGTGGGGTGGEGGGSGGGGSGGEGDGSGGGSGDGEGSNEPVTLVGRWYATQAQADAEEGFAFYEFTANGRLLVGGGMVNIPYTASNDRITVKHEGGPPATIDYSITGTKLTLSNPSSGASSYYMLLAGIFYKKTP
jgi:hypothetical protein